MRDAFYNRLQPCIDNGDEFWSRLMFSNDPADTCDDIFQFGSWPYRVVWLLNYAASFCIYNLEAKGFQVPFSSMSREGLESLPSRAWSCSTLLEGIEAAAGIAGVTLEPGKALDQHQAWPWDSAVKICQDVLRIWLLKNQILRYIAWCIHICSLKMVTHEASCTHSRSSRCQPYWALWGQSQPELLGFWRQGVREEYVYI